MENNKQDDKLDDEQKVHLLEERIKALEDQILRVHAEIENSRMRYSREFEEYKKYALQSIIIDMLPVLESLELAIEENVSNGIAGIWDNLINILQKYNFAVFTPQIGEIFDPNMHEPMLISNEDEQDDNSITKVLQKGYTINGRVIKPSRVVVNKKS